MSQGTVILTFRQIPTWSRCSSASRCPFICWPCAVSPHQQDLGSGTEAMGRLSRPGLWPLALRRRGQ